MSLNRVRGGMARRGRAWLSWWWIWLAVNLALAPAAAFGARMPEWEPIDPGVLAAMEPTLEPQAPAEMLFWQIHVDDRGFPVDSRRTDYKRYKIFSPDHVDHLTRVSERNSSNAFREVEIRARLILPDGTITEFDDDDIKERPYARSAESSSWMGRVFGESRRLNVKERFLPVRGVVRGAILDIQTTRKDDAHEVAAYVLQLPDVPIREVRYEQRIGAPKDFAHRAYLLNSKAAKSEITEDPKARTVTVVARDVPSLKVEPFAGTIFDMSLSILSSYERLNIRIVSEQANNRAGSVDVSKDGPWSFLATLVGYIAEDNSRSTRRIKQTAAAVTADAASPAEKAQRLHRFVQDAAIRYFKLPRLTERELELTPEGTLDRLAAFAAETAAPTKREYVHSLRDFEWLLLAMLREAGFTTRYMLVADRELMRFNPGLISWGLLSDACIGVQLGDVWVYGAIDSKIARPLGSLPWNLEGQLALVAKPGKQELVEIPFTSIESSTIATVGAFEIDAAGDLTGKGARRFGGQPGMMLRARLHEDSDEERRRAIEELMREDIEGAEITITQLAGWDQPGAPIDVGFELRVPGFAVKTRDRLVFPPSVFRARASSPFTSSERVHPVQLPFPWGEADRVQIRVPAGYAPEALETPPAGNAGSTMFHRAQLQFDQARGLVQYRREFACRAVLFAPGEYPALKEWNDRVIANDQSELVFIRRAPAGDNAGSAAAATKAAP